MIFKNKKGTSISIFILVLLTLLLTSTTLFYFIIERRDISKEVSSVTEFDRIYRRENLVNFHIQDIVDRSAEGVSDKSEFILRAKRFLGFYIDNSGEYVVFELSSINDQLINVELIEDAQGNVNSVSIDLEINIKESFTRKGEEVFSGDYTYVKTFTAET